MWFPRIPFVNTNQRSAIGKIKRASGSYATGPFSITYNFLLLEVNTCIVDSEVGHWNTLSAGSKDELVISLELL